MENTENLNPQGAPLSTQSASAPPDDPQPVTFQNVTPPTAPQSELDAPPITAPGETMLSTQVVAAPGVAAPAADVPTMQAPMTQNPDAQSSVAAVPESVTVVAPPADAATATSEMSGLLPNESRQLPSALFPGSFVAGDYEITGVLARGLTNLYAAQHGDYGNTVPCLLAEREIAAPSSQHALATPVAPLSTQASAGALTVEEAAGAGAFVEDADTLTASALPPAENQTQEERASVSTQEEGSTLGTDGLDADEALPPSGDFALSSPLFPPHAHFVGDDREYLSFAHFDSMPLQDHRESANDDRALAMLCELAQGLAELEERNLHATFSTETLRVEGDGHLRFLGFVGARESDDAAPVQQLRDVASFLLKRVFAEASTMRLDDELGSLPFSTELKEVVRKIKEGEYSSVAQARDELQKLRPQGTTLHAVPFLLSDVGMERELNEDAGEIVINQRAAHLGSHRYDFYIVADGMGGHEGGEVASDLTLSALQKRFAEYSANLEWNDNVAVRGALLKTIDAVNADVVALTEQPKYKAARAKPGATLCFGLRIGSRVFVGNVGDSRAYKFTAAGNLERVSKDHSYVQSLIDRGELTEEESYDHPDGSVILAHIGFPKLKTRDVFLRLFAPGDKLLIVSDGITDMLRDHEIAAHMNAAPDQICRSLVDAANEAGGIDNITVLCVQFN